MRDGIKARRGTRSRRKCESEGDVVYYDLGKDLM
jgi:hypothetical protein